MDKNLSYKESLIKNMDPREFGCSIKCLPPGVVCLFRDFSQRLIHQHEQRHTDSILGKMVNGQRQKPIRTKARYYEVGDSEFRLLTEKLRLQNGMENDDVETIAEIDELVDESQPESQREIDNVSTPMSKQLRLILVTMCEDCVPKYKKV